MLTEVLQPMYRSSLQFSSPQPCVGRVLILDDNDANRMLIKIALNMNGIESIEADEGEAALDRWQPGAFRFAILDIELPGISGLEVACRMRAQDAKIQIVMCSTNDDPQTIHLAVESGCDLFLVKPLQLEVLFSLVQQMHQAEPGEHGKVKIIENQGQTRWMSRSV